MTTQELNESLEELTLQQQAEVMPRQYFEVMTDRVENNTLPPALIFTADNLKSIKRYVYHVRRLPKNVAEISGSHNLSLIGLDARQVDRFYTNLRTHVGAWDELERETKVLGASLELFARDFVREGNDLIDQMRQTDAYRSLTARLGDVLDEFTVDSTRPTAMSEKDRRKVVSLRDYLGELKDSLDRMQSMTTALRERAQWFAQAVVEQLRPEVDGLMRQISEINPEAKSAELRNRIAALDKDIKVGESSYKDLVKYSLSGLAFGVFGVIITGGLYGSKAEALRKANNRKRDERAGLIRQLESISPMIAIFESITLQVSDLTFRLTEVETAAKNLEDVWAKLAFYVATSETAFGNINDDIQLTRFTIRFGRVISPWEDIQAMSAQLSKLFNEAIDEVNKEGVQP